MTKENIAYIKDLNEGKRRGYSITWGGGGTRIYTVRPLDGHFVVEQDSGRAKAVRSFGHEACQLAYDMAMVHAIAMVGKENIVDETNMDLRRSCLDNQLKEGDAPDLPIVSLATS